MKITMLDRVETAYTVALDFEGDMSVDQDGMRVLSRVEREAAGLRGCNYVLTLAEGAKLDLPDRLGKKLVESGHAKA